MHRLLQKFRILHGLSWALMLPNVLAVAAYPPLPQSHPCDRPCRSNDPGRVCEYTLTIELTQTMAFWCRDCPRIWSDCFNKNCITANGVFRTITPINRTIPGPGIHVCENDIISAVVINNLPSDSSTIHWHGMFQIGTPFMDGVPDITQCPINPGNKFHYRFRAHPSGTFFYHSHSGEQLGNGIFAPLIVRKPIEEEPTVISSAYDYDLNEHVMVVNDWYGDLAETLLVVQEFPYYPQYNQRKRVGMLVNGKGRFYSERDDKPVSKTPLAWFNVTRGYRYRFRIIAASSTPCPIKVSVDHHKLQIIAADLGLVEPENVDAFIIHAGERFDFVLTADQKESNYWIRLKGHDECSLVKDFDKTFQVAVLHYNGAPDHKEPHGVVNSISADRGGVVLNPFSINPTDLQITDLNSLADDDISLVETPTHQLAFDLNTTYVDQTIEFLNSKEALSAFFEVQPNRGRGLKFFTIDDILMTIPSSPILTQPEDVDLEKIACNRDHRILRPGFNYSACFHYYQLELNSVIEIVVVNNDETISHPFHLHGNAFRVVSRDQFPLEEDVNSEIIISLDKKGVIKRKLSRAPIKDTIIVPGNGFVILRLHASNPGFWMFHCHIIRHMVSGMRLVFQVGDQSDMSLPDRNSGFPRCGNFLQAPRLPSEERKQPVIFRAPAPVGFNDDEAPAFF